MKKGDETTAVPKALFTIREIWKGSGSLLHISTHIFVHIHSSVRVWRGTSGTSATQRCKKSCKSVITWLHKGFPFLTPLDTLYMTQLGKIPHPTNCEVSSFLGSREEMQIDSEVCTLTIHVFVTSKRERQRRYSKCVMEPPVHFTPCPIFPIWHSIFPMWATSTGTVRSRGTMISGRRTAGAPASSKTEADANLLPTHCGCQTWSGRTGAI